MGMIVRFWRLLKIVGEGVEELRKLVIRIIEIVMINRI